MAIERAELIDGLAEDLAVSTLTEAEVERVLGLAGVAAHGTGDRTSAPLVSFLAGIAVAGASDRMAALDDFRARLARMLANEHDGGASTDSSATT